MHPNLGYILQCHNFYCIIDTLLFLYQQFQNFGTKTILFGGFLQNPSNLHLQIFSFYFKHFLMVRIHCMVSDTSKNDFALLFIFAVSKAPQRLIKPCEVFAIYFHDHQHFPEAFRQVLFGSDVLTNPSEHSSKFLTKIQ